MTMTRTGSALVTGAARQAGADNIGSAIVTALGATYSVLAVDRREIDGESHPPGAAGTFRGDVTRSPDCQAMVAAAEALGPLKVVVHAAGITFPSVPVERIPPDEWDLVLATNLTSAFHVARAAIPGLRRSGGGSIVLVASRAGRAPFASRGVVPVATKAHYAASKAALISLGRSLALELAADGIRVNCVAPGPVKTAMMPEATWPAAAASVPLGRVAEPAEIARVVRFLCSDEASYVTGHTLDCNGGQSLS
jgi:NAD(P)-dependent dehydrogenase (short-subunit alcohol dehydrogenase family)